MIDKLKNEIIKNSKILTSAGFNIGSEGNLSIKVKDKIIITPSGINYEDLNINKISEVDLEGYQINNNKPSSEIKMHIQIYKRRKEINSIVHCHSVWASIISCLRETITSFHYMVAEFGGDDIKCSKYATFGSLELAKYIVQASTKRKGCLIANHGQVCFGKNIKEALNLSFALEKLSKEFYFCLISGKLKKISKSKMKEAISLFGKYKSMY